MSFECGECGRQVSEVHPVADPLLGNTKICKFCKKIWQINGGRFSSKEFDKWCSRSNFEAGCHCGKCIRLYHPGELAN